MTVQYSINQAVSKRKETKQYPLRKEHNIYPKAILLNYIFYRPKKHRIEQWVEPATHLGPKIPLGKNKPVGKNITLPDIYNKLIPEQKKQKKNQLLELVKLSTKEWLVNKPSRKYQEGPIKTSKPKNLLVILM